MAPGTVAAQRRRAEELTAHTNRPAHTGDGDDAACARTIARAAGPLSPSLNLLKRFRQSRQGPTAVAVRGRATWLGYALLCGFLGPVRKTAARCTGPATT